MPLFTVERDVSGAIRAEIDASAFRALTCAQEYENLRWIRSYWDVERERVLCLCEATSEAEIREHSERARIDCGVVREITEIRPDQYAPPAQSRAVAAGGEGGR